MASRQVYTCDICGEEMEEDQPFRYWLSLLIQGTPGDKSTDRMLDLCGLHAQWLRTVLYDETKRYRG